MGIVQNKINDNTYEILIKNKVLLGQELEIITPNYSTIATVSKINHKKHGEVTTANTNDIIDIITDAELHYNSALCSGVIFHTIGALSQYGRLGATCVAPTQEKAWRLAEETRSILKAKSKDLSWIH